jgi:hypothetical protein
MADEFRQRASEELARLIAYWKTIELWIKKAERVNGKAVIPEIDQFRQRASEELAQLLTYWKTIELWIKKAERVNGKAVIPAINELRYASRQIFQAVRLLEKQNLDERDKKTIEKRLIIGHQYLMNADHDVCDSIISFYAENIKHLDDTYGISEMSVCFVEYPMLRDRVRTCYDLVIGSRGEYNNRQVNYAEIRNNHFLHIIDLHKQLVDAEVSAKAQRERLERQVTIAQGSRDFLFWFTVGTGVVALLAFPLSIYLWLNGPQSFCKRHASQAAFSYVCSLAAPDEAPVADTPPTDMKLGEPAKPQQPDTAPHSTPSDDFRAKQSRENKL